MDHFTVCLWVILYKKSDFWNILKRWNMCKSRTYSILFRFLLFSSAGDVQNIMHVSKQANHIIEKVNVLNELASCVSLQLQARRNRTLLQSREMRLPALTQLFTLYHCRFTNGVWEIALALKYLARWLYRFILILSRYIVVWNWRFFVCFQLRSSSASPHHHLAFSLCHVSVKPHQQLLIQYHYS